MSGAATMTSAERLGLALSHREPDRVPFFLPLTMHGARELGIALPGLLTSPRHVAAAQLRLLARYGHDMVTAYTGVVEIEAFGGHLVYHEDAPPNPGAPPLRALADIEHLEPPTIADCPALQRTLEAIRLLHEALGASVPVMGAVIAPFSLPVVQLGFERYLELLLEKGPRLERLLAVNTQFAIAWAGAQLAAGAGAVAWVDPLASPDNIPHDVWLDTGYRSLCSARAALPGALALSTASGRAQGLVDDLVRAGVTGLGIAALDDLAAVKERCRGRLVVIGNMNGLAMRHWSPDDAQRVVRQSLLAAGPGGGYVLSEHHGEIPFDVEDDVLEAIADAVFRWGSYPIRDGPFE